MLMLESTGPPSVDAILVNGIVSLDTCSLCRLNLTWEGQFQLLILRHTFACRGRGAIWQTGPLEAHQHRGASSVHPHLLAGEEEDLLSETLRFSVDGHSLEVVEVDDCPVYGPTLHQLTLSPGQRYSVILNTTVGQDGAAFWMRANSAFGTCIHVGCAGWRTEFSL